MVKTYNVAETIKVGDILFLREEVYDSFILSSDKKNHKIISSFNYTKCEVLELGYDGCPVVKIKISGRPKSWVASKELYSGKDFDIYE